MSIVEVSQANQYKDTIVGSEALLGELYPHLVAAQKLYAQLKTTRQGLKELRRQALEEILEDEGRAVCSLVPSETHPTTDSPNKFLHQYGVFLPEQTQLIYVYCAPEDREFRRDLNLAQVRPGNHNLFRVCGYHRIIQPNPSERNQRFSDRYPLFHALREGADMDQLSLDDVERSVVACVSELDDNEFVARDGDIILPLPLSVSKPLSYSEGLYRNLGLAPFPEVPIISVTYPSR